MERNKIIYSPSTISTSQIINPISRAHSQISITQTMPSANDYNFASGNVYLAHGSRINDSTSEYNIYSQVNKENYNAETSIPVVRQSTSHGNEFDNYSQVISMSCFFFDLNYRNSEKKNVRIRSCRTSKKGVYEK